MKDILVVGGVTQDIFFSSSDFRVENDRVCFVWGEKFVVEDMVLSPGGGGANAAVGFSRLGLKVSLWARVGEDIIGQAVRKQLEQERVDTSLLEVDPKCKTAISALMSGRRGERTIVMYRGRADLLNLSVIGRSDFWEASWLYVGDLTGDLSKFEDTLFQQAADKKVKVVFIPGQQQLDLGIAHLAKVLDTVEVFILNLYEACTLLGEDYREYEDTASQPETISKVKNLLEQLSQYGPRIVAITKGPDGTQVYDRQQFYIHPAPEIADPVDTTGAGDAFSSGFVTGLVRGLPVTTSLALGTENAGRVVSAYGAQTGLLYEKQAQDQNLL